MNARYDCDPETGLPHVHDRRVTEAEAERVIAHPAKDEAFEYGSRQPLDQTQASRYLRVIYVPDEEGDGFFIVTGHPLVGKQLKAFRRRQRRRGR